ncbi:MULTISPECIES: hypothetical protein [Streptomyces]|uniref:Uncharacterized protein n=1 Tax=Streptomyces fimbriatus TaxID=68197 RepID=A0ABW0DAV2_STRFI
MLPYALDRPADAQDDGGMGEHDQDQGDVAEPARPPLSVTQARE